MSKNDDHVTETHSTPTTGQSRTLSRVQAALGRFWAGFKYSSLYIATSAMIEVGLAMILLGVTLNPAPLVVGLVTFAVYTNDRIADVETDAFSNRRKAEFISNYEHILQPLADGAYGVAVMIAIAGGPKALALTLLPGVFWLCYASNWFEMLGDSLRRLKTLLILNTTVVALPWAIVLTFLPLTFSEASIAKGELFVFVYFFLRVFIFVELSNIPDMEGDRRIGVSTIPVVFGVDRTRHALYILNGLTVGAVALAFVSSAVPLRTAGALFFGTVYSLAVTSLIGRWQDISTLIQMAEAEYFLTYILLLAVVSSV